MTITRRRRSLRCGATGAYVRRHRAFTITITPIDAVSREAVRAHRPGGGDPLMVRVRADASSAARVAGARALEAEWEPIGDRLVTVGRLRWHAGTSARVYARVTPGWV